MVFQAPSVTGSPGKGSPEVTASPAPLTSGGLSIGIGCVGRWSGPARVTGCVPPDQRLRGQSVEENAEQDGEGPNQFQLGP
jgi:hypothetical protein